MLLFLLFLQVFIELNHIKKCNTVRGVFVLEEFGNYIILILGLYSHGSNSNFQSSDSELHCSFKDVRECRLPVRSCLRHGRLYIKISTLIFIILRFLIQVLFIIRQRKGPESFETNRNQTWMCVRIVLVCSFFI